MNTNIPVWGSMDSTKEQRDHFQAALKRIWERHNYPPEAKEWLAKLPVSIETQQSVNATRKAIEGINRRREML